MLSIALEKVDFLPPTRVTDDTSVLTLKTLAFEPLLRWRPGGQAAPALFSAWTHSPDGRRFEFILRPGARFHDGEPVRAGHVLDFIDGILRSVDTFGMKWSYSRYLADARITASGDDRVVVENPRPLADILDIFCEFYICRADADGRPLLGTGPYRVDAFEPGRRASLVRLRGDGPERIEAHAMPAAEERHDALRAGRIDAALNLERVHGRLERDPSLEWKSAVNTLSVMYYLNCADGLFRQPAARRAVNHAVDKHALVRSVFDGLAAPASTVVSPYHLGMADARPAPIPFDRERAKRLLDTVEVPGRLRLRTPTYMPERAPEISAFVADALGAVGLDVAVEVEADRPEYARQVGRKEMGDMAIFDSSPQSTYRVLDDKISSTSRGVWWQGFDDPETQRLIEAANRAVEPGDREAAYGRCLSRLNAEPPWLYLLHPVCLAAARPGVAGIGIDHKGILTIGSGA